MAGRKLIKKDPQSVGPVIPKRRLDFFAAILKPKETRPVERDLMSGLLNATWSPADTSEEYRLERITAALVWLEQIKPGDELEGMLAVQMIGAHTAAMEAFRRAMHPTNQTPQLRDMNLRHATQLTELYIRQLEALDKRRGKGQQKVRVEQVNVEAGGQAVVGEVNVQRAPPSPPPEPPVERTESAIEQRATPQRRSRKAK